MMVYQGQRGCLLKLLLNQSHPKHLRKMRQCCHRPTSQRSVASLRRPVLRFLLHQLRCWLRRHKPSLSKLVQIDFHKFPPDFFSWENQNTFEQWPLQVSVTRMQQLEAFPHPKAKAKAGKEGETEKKKPKGKGRGRGGGKGRGKGGGKGRGKGRGRQRWKKRRRVPVKVMTLRVRLRQGQRARDHQKATRQQLRLRQVRAKNPSRGTNPGQGATLPRATLPRHGTMLWKIPSNYIFMPSSPTLANKRTPLNHFVDFAVIKGKFMKTVYLMFFVGTILELLQAALGEREEPQHDRVFRFLLHVGLGLLGTV